MGEISASNLITSHKVQGVNDPANTNTINYHGTVREVKLVTT